jgi:hypothetical protein
MLNEVGVSRFSFAAVQFDRSVQFFVAAWQWATQ